ncbi:hypothetical protein [Lacinutrix salivirga]
MYQPDEIKAITRKMHKYFDNPIALVAQESGKSRPTVSKFFNRKEIRPSSEELIYEACLTLLESKHEKTLRNSKKGKVLTENIPLPSQTSMKL